MPELRAAAERALAIARRELGAYFGQPLAYVFLAAFVGLAAGPALRAFFAQGVADLREPLLWLHLSLLLLAPAAAMRLWAEERAAGTLELLFTLPVRPLEAVLGKFAAGLTLIAAALAVWTVVPLSLLPLADLDLGQVAAGMLGALLLGATLLAAGMLASALTRSQVVAFVLGASFGVALVVGFSPDVVERLVPHELVEPAADLGALRHLESFDRGVLDTRDVVYFVGLSALLLGVNALALERRGRTRVEPALTALLAALAVAVALDLSAQRALRARVDVTLAGTGSLAPSTREALARLDGPLTVRAYLTQDLPPGYEHLRPQVRALVDLLHDLRDAAPDRVVLDLQDPLSIDDPAQRQDLVRRAELDGVPPTVVSSVSQHQSDQLRLYAGLAFLHGDRAPATLPRAILRDRLEYDVAAAIARVTLPRLRVALSGDGLADYGQARAALAQTYAVEELDLDARDVPAGVALLVHAAPVPPTARTLEAIERHVRGGGRALLLVETHAVDPSTWRALPHAQGPLRALLRTLGVDLGVGLALAPSERAHLFEVEGAHVQSRYPWLLDVGAAHDPTSPVLAGLGRVFMPFAAPVGPTDATVTWTPLAATAPGWTAGTDGRELDIHPLHTVAAASEGPPAPQVIAGAVAVASAAGGDAPPARLVVVGDSDFARDRNASEGEGVALLLNLVDWTVDRTFLAPERARAAATPLRPDGRLLGLEGEQARSAVLLLAGAIVPGLVLAVGLGGLELARRRREARAAALRDARSGSAT